MCMCMLCKMRKLHQRTKGSKVETTWWRTQVCNPIPGCILKRQLNFVSSGLSSPPRFCSAMLCCVLSESHLHTFELPSFPASNLLSFCQLLVSHLAHTYLRGKSNNRLFLWYNNIMLWSSDYAHCSLHATMVGIEQYLLHNYPINLLALDMCKHSRRMYVRIGLYIQ
jgi:hypothetical protein